MKKLPCEVRGAAKAIVGPARFGARRLTSRARALPDFVIIGAQRCGTTAFYDGLTSHGSVLRAAGKELHFFDYYWAKGEAWYRSQFPLRWRRVGAERVSGARAVTGEATPYYMFHPHVPRRAREIVPGAKLIVLLRDPVARAHSHYEWMTKHGREVLSFPEAIRAEASRLEAELERLQTDPGYHSPPHRNFSYLSRGLYAEQLRRWLRYFPREQMLVLVSEEFFRRPDDIFAITLKFLGLPQTRLAPRSPRPGQQYWSTLDPKTREFLIEYFRGPNAELSELLGRELPWPDR